MPNGQNKDVEAVKRELERRSQDTIIVYNPTKQDRKVVWNRFVHLVKAQSEAVLPRYIAEKYVKETVDTLILDRNTERVTLENERRIKAGMKAMDAQEREVFDWRTNNADLRKQFIPMVYKGIAEEYGKIPESEPTLPIVKPGMTDTDLFEQIDTQVIASREVDPFEVKEVSGVDLEVVKKKQQVTAKVAA